MKNISHIYMFAALAGMTLSACNKMEPASKQGQDDVQTMELKASAQQPTIENESKTTLGTDDKVLWSENDALAVFQKDAVAPKVEYKLTSGAGETSATFKGAGISGEVMAVYPSSFVNTDAVPAQTAEGYSIPVTIPAVQTYCENSFPDNACLAVGMQDGDNGLAFNNVMSVLELQMYASSARKISRIQLASAENLCGKAELSFRDDGSDPTITFVSDTSKILTLKIPDGVAISTDESAPTRFYLIVPAGTLKKGFTVAFTQSVDTEDIAIIAISRTSKDQTTKRNTIKEMPSAKATFSYNQSKLANTYLIAPGETLSFAPLKNDGSLVGHPKSCKTAINTAKGTGALLTIGSWRFIANADKGWAQVNASDYDGKVIWSWVMWINENVSDVTLTDGSVVLDRNLGALSAYSSEASKTDLRGLYFQWGRKDPLLNYSTASQVIPTSEEVGTVEYVTEHPNYFIIPADGTANANDWHWKGDNSLWGETKTIYDPCPAGYKVPEGTASTSFWQACAFNTNKGTYDSDKSGWPFKVIKDSEEPLFLVDGHVNYKSESGTGVLYAGGKYWCYNSVPMISVGNYSRSFTFSNTIVTEKTNSGRHYGMQIRCQKIK